MRLSCGCYHCSQAGEIDRVSISGATLVLTLGESSYTVPFRVLIVHVLVILYLLLCFPSLHFPVHILLLLPLSSLFF